ncbi:MAG: DUF5104 domain-containing protein [Oscillospiraceae bacterium]|nr:DUF5104 domain-containing protein [Oscillospiraceae bacterium]
MKKLFVIISALCKIFFHVGDGSFTIPSITHAENRLKEIIGYINSSDTASFKTLYSVNALRAAEELDTRIEYFFALLHKGIDTWHSSCGGEHKEMHYGIIKAFSRYEYKIESGGAEYRIFICEVTADTEHPDELGLYMVQLYTPEKRKTVFRFNEEAWCAGIKLSDELIAKVSP